VSIVLLFFGAQTVGEKPKMCFTNCSNRETNYQLFVSQFFFVFGSELTNRDNEIQKLNAEIVRGKEADKIVQRQTFEVEQLKTQLIEQQQNNHADESNKIEIRNLQNALDSSKKELEAQRVLVNDFKSKADDLNKQLSESKKLTNSKSSGDSFLVS
jgi:small-conductance mechanosensitive channel